MTLLEKIRGQAPRYHVNRGICAFDLWDYMRGHLDVDFDVNLPSKGRNLQRPLVWSDFQKEQLILSVIKGIDFGKVALVAVKHGDYRAPGSKSRFEVIDGKQRLSTLFAFVAGEFAVELAGRKYFFGQLPADCANEFYRLGIIADVGYSYEDKPITDDEKIQWFLRINFAGTPQDKEHADNLQSIL
jgi:hypothetical protein